jgi:hypothetical protein
MGTMPRIDQQLRKDADYRGLPVEVQSGACYIANDCQYARNA